MLPRSNERRGAPAWSLKVMQRYYVEVWSGVDVASFGNVDNLANILRVSGQWLVLGTKQDAEQVEFFLNMQ